MTDYQSSVSGVSLEEEEIRLLAYQHAYQAAARFINLVDELMQDLLDM
jgi:flagellar hook-associated protein 1 FlgK